MLSKVIEDTLDLAMNAIQPVNRSFMLVGLSAFPATLFERQAMLRDNFGAYPMLIFLRSLAPLPPIIVTMRPIYMA